jgi:CBS domain-containing protein
MVKERGAGAVRHRPLAALIGNRATRSPTGEVEPRPRARPMSAPALTVEAGATIQEAAEAMVSRGVNRLPVTDGGALVGIVTRADLVRAYVRSDEQLAATIRDDVLRRTLWLDPAGFEVAVVDGVARIRGVDPLDRRHDRTIAAMVPSVVGSTAGGGGRGRDIDPPADYISSTGPQDPLRPAQPGAARPPGGEADADLLALDGFRRRHARPRSPPAPPSTQCRARGETSYGLAVTSPGPRWR